MNTLKLKYLKFELFRARYGVCDFGEINRFFTNPYGNDPDSGGTDDKNKTWDARTKNMP